ncbi:MAG TPA: subclass B3 metallo-beta-lactamase [Bryobacteraceae bacterium]|nr:subclass B3 metallo-beta-lactamase [Bryobacteraceae bacterium]
MRLQATPVFLTVWFCATSLLAQNNHVEGAWNKPIEPYRIAGNIYYVGTNFLASFLFVTPEGNILLNSDYEESVPLIRASIEKLGFRFADTKFLLSSQAHNDHSAGDFLVRELTGARVLVMQGDDDIISNGGKGDFRFDGEISWKPCKVDRVLHDGDTVKLGGTTLVAHHTPGHTKGCTTWTTTVQEGDRKLNVVIVGGTGINSGVRLLHNAKYPGIVEDYARTFRILRALPCDLFLGAHGVYYDMDAKLARFRAGEKPNPFIDKQGYLDFIDSSERNYLEQLSKEKHATP